MGQRRLGWAEERPVDAVLLEEQPNKAAASSF